MPFLWGIASSIHPGDIGMKNAVIGALLLTAAVAAPAHAAFTISCKTQIEKPAKDAARPIQWRWDGSEVSTTYTTHEKEEKSNRYKPVHFVQRDSISGIVNTYYGFVTAVLSNGDRQSRTYHVFERDNQLLATGTWNLVTPEGAVVSSHQNEYRNCTWKKS